MDRGIRATWYDLPEQGREEYISWLHEVHLPSTLRRPGYLWAAHIENDMNQEREQRIDRNLTHTTDASVPASNQYLVLHGAASPHVFVDPRPAEIRETLGQEARQMLGRRINPRRCIFVEVDRVNGPEVKSRHPGITPGPVIQLGSFNINAVENEPELEGWYARSRLPLMAPMPGCVGARKLVSITGWAKHAILYEFLSMEAVEQHFVDPDPWSRQVVANLIHAPHSPSLGMRIWPPV